MCDRETLLKFQQLVRSIPVSKHVTGYAVDLVRATRPDGAGRAGVHQGAGRLGRRAARQPGADPVRQDATRRCPAGSTSPATTCATWRCRCCGIASAVSFAAEAEGITHRRDRPQAAGRVPERKTSNDASIAIYGLSHVQRSRTASGCC